MTAKALLLAFLAVGDGLHVPRARLSPRGGAVSCVARLRSPKPLAQYEDPGPEHLRTVDGFLGETAETLRTVFDERFEEPRQAHPMRFCWDYWHVPSQYTLHRTQAASYFDEDAFAALTDALTAFGQRELGCRAISPPWLSFYVDGCEQRLHADVPQATAWTTLPDTARRTARSQNTLRPAKTPPRHVLETASTQDCQTRALRPSARPRHHASSPPPSLKPPL